MYIYIYTCIYMYICDISTFLQNNFDLPACIRHFVQGIKELWYPGRAIVELLRYQISQRYILL